MRRGQQTRFELPGVSHAAIEALPALAEPLLEWYDRERRALPWREEPTPYGIWLSEILLQQTRVEAVLGAYVRFLKAMPTIADLAEASEDDLLRLWEGLGFYKRVQDMRRSARIIVKEYDGELPNTYEKLRALPGIGEYTAGAIASIAFGVPVPAVDGNVVRVLSRLLASKNDAYIVSVRRSLTTIATYMIPGERAGDFNQALMELGALVCLPNSALRCGVCPLKGACLGRKKGVAAELPFVPEKRPKRVEERTIIYIRAGEKTLLFRRRNKGLLAGMYEPLNIEGKLTKAEIAEAVKSVGGEAATVTQLPSTKHIFSHIEWHMRSFVAECQPFEQTKGVWAEEGEYPMSSAFKK